MAKLELETFSSVVALQRSIAEERNAKSALLECASAFSPRIEGRSRDNTFLCVIDIAGTERLLGQPGTLANTLLERVRALGIESCVAISGNFDTSICVAKGMSHETAMTVIPHGEEGTTLAPLPLMVLDLSEEQAETFSLWGIRTLGMLAALPEKELIARMGQESQRLRQLARGGLPHLFIPIEPEFRLEEHMELDGPVEMLDSLLFVVRVMLEQLIVRAKDHITALASVTITLHLENNTSHTQTVKPALPSNDLQLWIKLLQLDLQAHPPQAAILALTLIAEPGSTRKIQLGLFSSQLPEPMRLDVTLARIRNIVGEYNVGRAVLNDAHQPDGFHIEHFTISSGSSEPIRTVRSALAMRQLRPPENISITVDAGVPLSCFFREKLYQIERAYGPWKTSGNWWNPMLWQQEQWDVIARSNEGQFLCCCLVHDLTRKCWQMAGLYD